LLLRSTAITFRENFSARFSRLRPIGNIQPKVEECNPVKPPRRFVLAALTAALDTRPFPCTGMRLLDAEFLAAMPRKEWKLKGRRQTSGRVGDAFYCGNW
jgi:hypothetical protein